RWQRRTRERGEPLPEPADDGRPADADHRAMLADLAGRLPRDQQRGAPALIEFLKQAFAAEEMEIHREPAGTVVHAKIRVGGSVVLITRRRSLSPWESRTGSPRSPRARGGVPFRRGPTR